MDAYLSSDKNITRKWGGYSKEERKVYLVRHIRKIQNVTGPRQWVNSVLSNLVSYHYKVSHVWFSEGSR